MIRELVLIFVAFCGGEVCGILTALLPGPQEREQPQRQEQPQRPHLRRVK